MLEGLCCCADFSLVVVGRSYSSLQVHKLHVRWLLLFRSMSSLGTWFLTSSAQGLSSCCTQFRHCSSCSMKKLWNLPRLRTEPVSQALPEHIPVRCCTIIPVSFLETCYHGDCHTMYFMVLVLYNWWLNNCVNFALILNIIFSALRNTNTLMWH